jgi:CheY-like chemotaxis protein
MPAVEIIDAGSRLLLTLLAGYLIWSLRKPLQNLFTRKGSEVSAFGVTIKVGDQEVPVQNATDQLRAELDDLQSKVIDLLKWQAALVTSDPSTRDHEQDVKEPISDIAPVAPRPKRILWVDDVPANNAYLVQRLRNQGVAVTLVTSTDEGLRIFQESGPFTAVITDMGRQENNEYRPTAGLELSKRLRELDAHVPVLAYTSARSVRSLSENTLRDGGITLATSSPVELLTALQIDQ